MSWSTPSIYAPATMTKAQLQGIYNCTYTDWGQVGGIPGHPIQRYMPQSNSGTYSFFLSNWLGGVDPALVSSTTPPAGSTFPCPAVINTQLDNAGKPLEENTGNELDAARYQRRCCRTRSASGSSRPTTTSTPPSICATA